MEWRTIIGFRNIFVHAYHRIDEEPLWDVVRTQAPALLQRVRRIEAVEAERDAEAVE